MERINECYKGEFTEADRVMLSTLHDKLRKNTKLASSAKSSDPQIFQKSVFPDAFEAAAIDSFNESQDSYKSLFEDQQKYVAVMNVLAEKLYSEMRQEENK